MSRIGLLHTADIHVKTFDGLFAGQGVELVHLVRADLLARARSEGLDAVAHQMGAALAQLADCDAVMCSCSTLGPLVGPGVLRIDQPVMEKVRAIGGRALVAICLDSTRQPTLDLLAAEVPPLVVLCDQAWPFFEASDTAAFAATIRAQVEAALVGQQVSCILLAQASMRVAQADLAIATGLPVLSSPQPAVDRLMEMIDKT